MKQIQNKNICSSVRRPAYTTGAFTLVELIVVITIIAILGTIAFISLQGYSAHARDSKRLSDIQNIKKSLELFSLNTGKYPEPDSSFTVSYSGDILWYQGIAGEQVARNLGRNLNKKPVDPLTEEDYTYSRTYAGTEYELLTFFESDIFSLNYTILNKSYASDNVIATIDGNYNGVALKTNNYIFPTPSLMSSLKPESLELEFGAIAIKSQIVNGGNYNNSNFINEGNTGTLDINFRYYELKDGYEIESDVLGELIQEVYTGSQISNKGIYKDFLDSENVSLLVEKVVLKKVVNSAVEKNILGGCLGKIIQGEEYNNVDFTYTDILHNGVGTGTGYLEIGNGTKEYVINLKCNDGEIIINEEFLNQVECNLNYSYDSDSDSCLADCYLSTSNYSGTCYSDSGCNYPVDNSLRILSDGTYWYIQGYYYFGYTSTPSASDCEGAGSSGSYRRIENGQGSNPCGSSYCYYNINSKSYGIPSSDNFCSPNTRIASQFRQRCYRK